MNRPIGLSEASAARASPAFIEPCRTMVRTLRSRSGVSVNPGHTELTVIPVFASSRARDRTSPTTPCFAAQ